MATAVLEFLDVQRRTFSSVTNIDKGSEMLEKTESFTVKSTSSLSNEYIMTTGLLFNVDDTARSRLLRLKECPNREFLFVDWRVERNFQGPCLLSKIPTTVTFVAFCCPVIATNSLFIAAGPIMLSAQVDPGVQETRGDLHIPKR